MPTEKHLIITLRITSTVALAFRQVLRPTMRTRSDDSKTREIIDEALDRGLPRKIQWRIQRTFPRLGLSAGDDIELHLRATTHNDDAPILWYEGQVRGGDGFEAFRTGGYGSTMDEAVEEAKAKLEENGCA